MLVKARFCFAAAVLHFVTHGLQVTGQQNIWGSPSTGSGHMRDQEQGLRMLLKQMQRSSGEAGRPAGMSSSLPQALTLEQVEGARIPAMPPLAAKAMTLEELENQMTGI